MAANFTSCYCSAARSRAEAAAPARRAVQAAPVLSVSHTLLVALLVKLGSLEDAKRVAAQVVTLQPSFSAQGFCAALALPPKLAEPLAEAWRGAGLPP